MNHRVCWERECMSQETIYAITEHRILWCIHGWQRSCRETAAVQPSYGVRLPWSRRRQVALLRACQQQQKQPQVKRWDASVAKLSLKNIKMKKIGKFFFSDWDEHKSWVDCAPIAWARTRVHRFVAWCASHYTTEGRITLKPRDYNYPQYTQGAMQRAQKREWKEFVTCMFSDAKKWKYMNRLPNI